MSQRIILKKNGGQYELLARFDDHDSFIGAFPTEAEALEFFTSEIGRAMFGLSCTPPDPPDQDATCATCGGTKLVPFRSWVRGDDEPEFVPCPSCTPPDPESETQ